MRLSEKINGSQTSAYEGILKSALNESENLKEARSHKEKNEKAAPRKEKPIPIKKTGDEEYTRQWGKIVGKSDEEIEKDIKDYNKSFIKRDKVNKDTYKKYGSAYKGGYDSATQKYNAVLRDVDKETPYVQKIRKNMAHQVKVDRQNEIANKKNESCGKKKLGEDVAINNGFDITKYPEVQSLADDIANSIKDKDKITIDTVIEAIENWDGGDTSVFDIIARVDKDLAGKIEADEDNKYEVENQFLGLVEDTLGDMGITVYDEYNESCGKKPLKEETSAAPFRDLMYDCMRDDIEPADVMVDRMLSAWSDDDCKWYCETYELVEPYNDFKDEDHYYKDLYGNIRDITGQIVEDEEIDESCKAKLQERNLTRAERYNKNMEKIWATYEAQLNKYADYLKQNGFSDEEIKELRNNTGLGASALPDKAREVAEKNGPDEWGKLHEGCGKKKLKEDENLKKYIITVEDESGENRQSFEFLSESNFEEVCDEVYSNVIY